MAAILSVQNGIFSGRGFRLGRRTRVGRSTECEISLPDAGLAPCHFVVEDRGGQYWLTDLGSGQGTYVDGGRAREERLRDGTTIYAGEAVLYFREPSETEPDRAEVLEPPAGADLENEVRRIYESSVTVLADPEPTDDGRDAARTALSALYRIGRLSGGEADLGGLFEGTARVLLEALSGSRCLLLLSEGTARYRRAAEAPGEGAPGPAPPAEVLHRAAGEGLSILIRDTSKDPRFPAGPARSVVCAPLKAARKVLGALVCEGEAGGRAFDENDLKLATAVGRQSGGAIERRILEKQIQEHTERLETRVAERTADLEKALADLRTAQARLVASERMAAVGLLVQGIAHNMATPLSGILGYAQVLKERNPGLPHVDEIIRLSRHLDGILENLLTKGRRENRAEPVPVDLNAVVDETLKFFEGDLFFKHEVEVRREKALGLPPVWGLWSDWSQGVQNLVRNALDALREAPRKVLTVRTRAAADHLAVEVEDTGCGIAPEHSGSLFEPFFTTKGARGTGLGLFSARNLLAPYGAGIEWEPRSPGTVFRIRIPRGAVGEGSGR